MTSNTFTAEQQKEIDDINAYWTKVDAAIAEMRATAETRRVDESFRLAEAKAEDEEMALAALAAAESALAANVGLQTPAAEVARTAYRIAVIRVADAQAKAYADLMDAVMLEAAKCKYRAAAFLRGATF